MKLKTLIASAAALAISSVGTSAIAAHIIAGSVSETIIESRLPGGTGTQNAAQWTEVGAFGSGGSWANSTAKSTAPGLLATAGSRFNSNAEFGAYFQAKPTLPTAGGVYDVYVTTPDTASNADVSLVSINIESGGTGLPATTPAFAQGISGNTWALIGQITLNAGVTNPVIRFTETSHSDPSTSRIYGDGLLFAEVNVIPEPSTFLLTGLGLVGLGVARRRRS